MKLRQVFVILITFGLILVTFQNCGENFSGQSETSSVSLCKLSRGGLAQSPFDSRKVILNSFQGGFTQSSSHQKLGSKATKYALVVDVSCVQEQTAELTFLNQNISLTDRQKTLPSAVMDVDLSGALSIAALDIEMEKSRCFIGLTENHEVKLAQSLTPVPVNDPQSSQQHHLGYLGHSVSRGLQKDITSKVVVAVIDSGIDASHADLDSRMWVNPTTGANGYNYVNNSNNVFDDNGHGTHVAGIIAAIDNNSYGVSGLTGDYVELMALKALGRNGLGSESDIYQAILDAVSNGADIINLSIEQRDRNTLMESAIAQAINSNVVVVTAAGNQAELMTTTNLFAPGYLGSQYNGAINVASVNVSNSVISNFSNYGPQFAEIAAPGAYIAGSSISAGVLSTAPNNGWARLFGTSQATPMVSSAAAMMIGYLKTQRVPYNNAGIESFIKSDGSARFETLVPYVENGKILNLGFLAQNLAQYLVENDNPDFQSTVTTGNVCVVQ